MYVVSQIYQLTLPQLVEANAQISCYSFQALLPLRNLNFFIVLCWCIWHERNAKFHGSAVKTATTILQFAQSYLLEFQTARAKIQRSYPQQTATVMEPNTSTRFSSKPRWLAPPSGRLKLNSDAAIDNSKGIVGIDAVLRNSAGAIAAAFSKPLRGRFKYE
uniref:RNase H type-1 domain-containing protein n=1 Tax=Cannabis sativa TaxID=3483 RepID=A0A803QBS7_CANSA